MAEFTGFPDAAQKTPIPNIFFSSILPQIHDLAELKVALHVFWALFGKKGYPRYVTLRELAGDKTLMSGLGGTGGDGQEALERGLKGAVDRGVLIATELQSEGRGHSLYFLNTESDRRARERIRNGEIDLGALPVPEPYSEEPRPNIFALYEDNIGHLTPLVAEMLKEAERSYPESWIIEAIGESVRNGVPRWSYIEAILRKWKAEGKAVGETGRHSKEGEDTERYFRGRYGHLVKRRLS
ncbi:MAG: DnaD domain protein [Dehalococcoidia bacterium]